MCSTSGSTFFSQHSTTNFRSFNNQNRFSNFLLQLYHRRGSFSRRFGLGCITCRPWWLANPSIEAEIIPPLSPSNTRFLSVSRVGFAISFFFREQKNDSFPSILSAPVTPLRLYFSSNPALGTTTSSKPPSTNSSRVSPLFMRH